MFAVRAARAHEAADIAELFARVLQNDPYWYARMPRESRRTRFIHRKMLSDLERGGIDAVDVAVHEPTGHIVGALRWGRVERACDRSGRLRRVAAFCSAELWRERVVELLSPAQEHWSVRELAVDPELEGLGLSALLLKHRLGEMDRFPAPVVLVATSRSRERFYKPFGFRTMTKLRNVPGTDSALMVRAAPGACAPGALVHRTSDRE